MTPLPTTPQNDHEIYRMMDEVYLLHQVNFPSSSFLFFFQEVQIFRIYILGEEELGQTQPQVMCFMSRFLRSDFITADAMSKLRQVCNIILKLLQQKP